MGSQQPDTSPRVIERAITLKPIPVNPPTPPPTSTPPPASELSIQPVPSPLPTRLPRLTPTTAATPPTQPTVPVLLEVEAGDIRKEQTFEVRVTVGAGTDGPVDTAQVYLEFQPENLQVKSISYGPRMEYQLLSTWNNTLGSVKYAAGTLGPPAEAPFNLFTVAFQSTAQIGSASTQIRFADPTNIHRTKVITRGLDVTGRLIPLNLILR